MTPALVVALLCCGARSRHVEGDVDGDVDVDVDVDADDDVDVDADVDSLCDSNPAATGCPCDSIEPEICYFGPPATLGLGQCRAGIHDCRDRVWGPCDGQVLPGDEVCDEADNNCDGTVDEGVTNECGTCAAECTQDCVGIGCDPFDPDGSNSADVAVDADGALGVRPGAATGWYTHVFAGCEGGWGTSWGDLDWEAEVPGASSIGLEARTSSSLAELAATEWTRIGSIPPDAPPIDLSAALGYGYDYEYLEVRVTLTASKDGQSPRLLWLAVDYFCGGDIS